MRYASEKMTFGLPMKYTMAHVSRDHHMLSGGYEPQLGGAGLPFRVDFLCSRLGKPFVPFADEMQAMASNSTWQPELLRSRLWVRS